MTAVRLTFNPAMPECRDALSAVVQIGDTLWLANDETTHLERLTRQGEDAEGNPLYAAHTRFVLQDYLQLPVAADADDNEVDLEGLAYADGYLWMVGSHSLKRKKPKFPDANDQSIQRLGRITWDANRYLLARISLTSVDGVLTLQTPASQLPIHRKGNALTDALREDPHLGEFFAIPGKDNGFDIEGLAVAGKRIFLGLRGPVLRGWAVILEVAVRPDADDPSTLQLLKIGENKRPYRKHFLQLGGLGVRDLCVQGDDLLILAGPTMSLDGPVNIYRWQGGALVEGESVVAAEHLPLVLAVPYGGGDDHAEGITLWQQPDGTEGMLLVYDSAATGRKRGENSVLADLYNAPAS
ncbi:DUF3616 domain-containing protein [Thiothrix lacustris]|uniref:DUF3616 domain-containing protein n=1 Tax=Thiothrix lacustris TaxID=525917 RepID=UPI0027E5A74B|nr:DUF3616 domain-containing protein [Thiothrix lacustris]WMP15898.1 DUF3616 domain-containing protein [Thiothrix lacustris]